MVKGDDSFNRGETLKMKEKFIGNQRLYEKGDFNYVKRFGIMR